MSWYLREEKRGNSRDTRLACEMIYSVHVRYKDGFPVLADNVTKKLLAAVVMWINVVCLLHSRGKRTSGTSLAVR